MEIDGRVIIEDNANEKLVTREQQAEWLVNCLTKGDMMVYAQHIREEIAKRKGVNEECG